MTSRTVALFSFGPGQFSMLHTTCEVAGFTPVAYVYCRSKKPRTPTSAEVGETLGQVLGGLPPGMDLLVPGSSEGLQAGLAALRNGDRTIGVTVHRMDERFDAGPILAQRDDIPLGEDVDAAQLWTSLNPIVGELLSAALELGDGEPQDETKASYAGFLEQEFSVVDWSQPARVIHNQVRTWRFMGAGPVATVDGADVRLLRTRLEPGEGRKVNCGDGPLWIAESAPASPS